MRLRPSGRAGPLASRVEAFASYQRNEAWTWEHMALTRARVIVSSPGLKERIEHIIHDVLTQPRDPEAVASDVLEMRRAIGEEKGERDIWDLKYAAGGLVDIEFIAQFLQLVHAAAKPDILSVSTLQALDNASRLGVLPSASADVLRTAVRLYHDLTQILRLCVSAKFSPATAGEDLLHALARAGDAPNFSVVEARVREIEADVRGIFMELLGRPRSP
jgi:glutamate-ammonia-ligase adenylyltransferase